MPSSRRSRSATAASVGVLLELGGFPDHDVGLGGERGQELLDQPALADPPLAEDGHQVGPGRLARALERLEQEGELAPPADHGDRPPVRPGGEPLRRPSPDLALEAPGRDDPRRAERHRQVGQLPGDLVGKDLSGLGRLLEPLGEVHGRAGHQQLVGRARPGGHQPRGQADPDPERRGQRQALGQTGGLVTNHEAGPQGAKGVGLVRLREAEHRHRRVAHELLGPSPRDSARRTPSGRTRR